MLQSPTPFLIFFINLSSLVFFIFICRCLAFFYVTLKPSLFINTSRCIFSRHKNQTKKQKMRPKMVLFGDSITEESFNNSGWGASLTHHFARVVCHPFSSSWFLIFFKFCSFWWHILLYKFLVFGLLSWLLLSWSDVFFVSVYVVCRVLS